MSHRMHRLFVSAAALILVADACPQFTHAAEPPNQTKPMIKKEPMAGEMKKDGMLKEDVSKAARSWDKKMDEMMKKEKMK